MSASILSQWNLPWLLENRWKPTHALPRILSICWYLHIWQTCRKPRTTWRHQMFSDLHQIPDRMDFSVEKNSFFATFGYSSSQRFQHHLIAALRDQLDHSRKTKASFVGLMEVKMLHKKKCCFLNTFSSKSTKFEWQSKWRLVWIKWISTWKNKSQLGKMNFKLNKINLKSWIK